MKTERQIVGRKGEEEACRYLMDRGHVIVERNWRSSHLETDIISFDDTQIDIPVYDYREEVEPETVEEETVPFVLVEQKPSFQGGDANAFSRWIAQHLDYPEIAKENGVEGRVVLEFTVLKDGTLGNLRVLRSVDPSLDKEALRVVSSSPKWEPGRQRDRAVNVTYQFPVVFQLR